MVIYKLSAKEKKLQKASTRQAVFFCIWGFIAGVYCWQPLIKAMHVEEKSILAKYVKIEGNQVVTITPDESSETEK